MKPRARQVFSDPAHFLAFGFGAGLAPVAPGTFGTLAALPLVAATWPLPLTWRIVIAVVLVLVGTWACGASSRKLGVHDFGGIVIDEIAAFYLMMLFLPATWTWLATGFLAFRVFDIAKPWPIGQIDRNVPGGPGIMLDDIMAALFSVAVLQLARYIGMQIS